MAFEEWLTAKPGQRAATRARDRAAIDTHFSPAIGHLTLPSVTPTHVRSIVTAMQARGLSPKSVRTYVGTLQDLKELLELGKAGKIEPIPIETRSAERATESLADLKAGGKVPGRVVMTH